MRQRRSTAQVLHFPNGRARRPPPLDVARAARGCEGMPDADGQAATATATGVLKILGSKVWCALFKNLHSLPFLPLSPLRWKFQNKTGTERLTQGFCSPLYTGTFSMLCSLPVTCMKMQQQLQLPMNYYSWNLQRLQGFFRAQVLIRGGYT